MGDEVQSVFDAVNAQMPANTIGHTVPVFTIDMETGESLIKHPDGHIESTGKTYSI